MSLTGKQIYHEVLEQGSEKVTNRFLAGKQRVERRLRVLGLVSYGKTADVILNKVHKAGFRNFSVGKDTDGTWCLVAWEYR